VLAFDGEAAIFGDEAAVVLGGAGGVASDAVVFGDVERGAERDDGGVDRDGDERRDALAGGAASPRKLLLVEQVEADVLAGARAFGGRASRRVAFGGRAASAGETLLARFLRAKRERLSVTANVSSKRARRS
jgi:hypothetical protein